LRVPTVESLFNECPDDFHLHSAGMSLFPDVYGGFSEDIHLVRSPFFELRLSFVLKAVASQQQSHAELIGLGTHLKLQVFFEIFEERIQDLSDHFGHNLAWLNVAVASGASPCPNLLNVQTP
jgi:hypothetical protein